MAAVLGSLLLFCPWKMGAEQGADKLERDGFGGEGVF